MFVQESGSNFSWNAYTVEAGQTNPETGYSFLRDDNNTGNWHVLVNTIGLSTTDPNYASYPNGNWRIDALGFACVPTMKLANVQSTYLKSHSNTIKPVASEIKESAANNIELTIYPNPATDNLTIIFSQKPDIEILNIEGKVLRSINVSDYLTTIDISGFAKGMYFIKVKNEEGIEVKKFIKE